MTTANLPHNWKARDYQVPACNYLDSGGKHAELIWHRRAGKDEVALHHAACQMADREATYWHMLPLANQVRKAIWEAINPHTGKRRIHEAFPPHLFEHRESDMFIKARFNNSTWQCLGSDNYEGAIGSPPAGVVYSEWALAKPSARGYLRPILAENNGYQVYITTPRGKNHAYKTYNAAKKNPNAFAQVLTIADTGILTPEQLEIELAEYISTYGEDMGRALYEQEYFCSFEAAILGAYYGAEASRLEKEGRLTFVPHDPDYPVWVAMDIGRTDDTSVWFLQLIGGEPRVIDFFSVSGKDPDWVASEICGYKVDINIEYGKVKVYHHKAKPTEGAEHRQAYDYCLIGVPHDALAKTFAAHGKSVQEQFSKVWGWSKVKKVPDLSFEDGIQATRYLMNRMVVDEDRCGDGWEAVKQYRREWDDDKHMFKDKALHDWTSHPADGLRYLSLIWREPAPEEPKEKGRTISVNKPSTMTLDDLWKAHEEHINTPERI